MPGKIFKSVPFWTVATDTLEYNSGCKQESGPPVRFILGGPLSFYLLHGVTWTLALNGVAHAQA